MPKRTPLSANDNRLYELDKRFDAYLNDGEPLYLEDEELADLADSYDNNYNSEKADKLMDYALKLHPESSMLWILSANRYIDRGMIDEAQGIADNMVDDDSPDLLILRAKLLILSGRAEEGDLLIDEATPDYLDPVAVAFMYIDTHMPDKAYKWLTEKGAGLESDTGYMTVLAGCLYFRNELQKAIDLYNQLLDRDPFSSGYWLGLARCHFAQLEWGKAIDDCDFAITNDENYLEPFLLRACAFVMLGNEQKALDDIRHLESVTLLDDVCSGSLDLANLADRGHYAEAASLLEFFLAHTQTSLLDREDMYYRLGICLTCTERTDEAIEAFDQALSIDPDDMEVLMQKGHAYILRNDIHSGFECWRKVAENDPSALTYERLGYLCLEDGLLSTAISLFELAIGLNPIAVHLYKVIAVLALVEGDSERFKHYNAPYPLTPEQTDRALQFLKEENPNAFDLIVRSLGNDLPPSMNSENN